MSDEVHWRRSSYSDTSGKECVELAVLHGSVGVRDSKDPEGPKLVLSRRQVGELLRVARNA
ncbi:DUF397 domain-containing protein [Actinomadura yumaensis]|uniref:DUF397 domain-containing protein n=1 Tax=Actinomadura yumaensis TaxID=111807 RepID=A0ABW2CN72_9ACTN